MGYWDNRYDTTDYVFGETPNTFLAAQAGLLPKTGRALAIADGEGRNGVWLAEQGLSTFSFDFSPLGLEKARRLADKRGVALETALVDIAEYDWPAARFDVVTAIYFQFAPPALRDAIFAGIIRTLAPGGLLILSGYRPEQLVYGTGGPGILENLYTEELLRDRFAALEIVSLVSHDSVVGEGTGHVGISALIDLVARKPA